MGCQRRSRDLDGTAEGQDCFLVPRIGADAGRQARHARGRGTYHSEKTHEFASCLCCVLVSLLARAAPGFRARCVPASAAIRQSVQQHDGSRPLLYGTIRTWANLLRKKDVAALLEDTLEEEKRRRVIGS